MAKVLVLGAGFGGVNTCLRMIGSEHDVKLLDMKGHHQYTPGLVDLFRDRRSADELRIDLNQFFGDTDIEFSREKVERILPGSKRVKTNAGEHEYKYLVLSLGAEPRTFGVDLEHAHSPYSLEKTQKIVERVEEAEQTCIIGSGYVGVEVAAEIKEKTDVTMIEGATRPMPNSCEKAGHLVLDYFNAHNINFNGGKKANRIEEDQVVLEDGSAVTSDLTIWAGGLKANDVVTDSFDCGPEGIDVDETLRSKQFPDVFALGDCAEIDALKTAHNAMKQAKIVAANSGRGRSKMAEYSSSKYPLMVSLGETGMMVRGKRAYKNRVFRTAKDMVFRGYKANLKARKLKRQKIR